MQVGEVVELGSHRLMCGDSTNPEHVAALMQGEKALLLHADPPYGMGKAKDGVTNDNLYREKLDAFQMAWWQTCRPHIADNASAYIWGNAEDLWRLWFRGGLNESERLTFRNEIVWHKVNPSGKSDGNGIGSGVIRMYAPLSERCLFFMFGQQEHSANADNYWENWEPIRAYLDGERQRMGWDVPTVKRIVGHSDLARDHWFSRSQWNFPTRKVYTDLQRAAEGAAFKRDYDSLKRDYDSLKRDYDSLKRDYDSLKRDWYATRSHFDGAHGLFTEVWPAAPVKGTERWGHPTPKPVQMIERVCKTSAPEGGLILDPFGGSGSTLIAADNTNRRAYLMDIKPRWCDVIIDRYEQMTQQQALPLSA